MIVFSSKIAILDKVKHIKLEGRIDMSNASECEEMILANLIEVDTIVLDLTGLTFIDSTGVGCLLSSIQSAHNNNVDLELTNIPEGIGQVLAVIGVFDVLKSLKRAK